MKSVKVESGQTIFDICIQEYGTLENAFKIHQDNALLEFPSILQPGEMIDIDTNFESPDQYSVNLLRLNKPATDVNITGYVRMGGIGFMQIGVDFKVS